MGSSPAEGSSRNRIGGSSAMARAIPARLAMPPEISAGSRSAASDSPTRPSLTRATSARASAGRSVCSCSGTSTFSAKVEDPNSAPDCHMTPIRVSSAVRAASSWPAIASPRISMVPSAGG